VNLEIFSKNGELGKKFKKVVIWKIFSKSDEFGKEFKKW
jgi:hypothetical protein